MADHAHEPTPRLAFFIAERAAQIGDHEQLVGPAALAEASPANFPPARAAREYTADNAPRRLIEQSLEA
jgi:hypothetical protein